MNNLEGSKFLPHLPPLQYYDVDNMNIEKCEKILIWYENNKHKCFNFYEELLKYCRSDCKAQPHRASLGYPFCNMAAYTEATPTREGI